jgi:hypothetical protein
MPSPNKVSPSRQAPWLMPFGRPDAPVEDQAVAVAFAKQRAHTLKRCGIMPILRGLKPSRFIQSKTYSPTSASRPAELSI